LALQQGRDVEASLLLLLLHGKRTEKRQQDKVFEKEVNPPKNRDNKNLSGNYELEI